MTRDNSWTPIIIHREKDGSYIAVGGDRARPRAVGTSPEDAMERLNTPLPSVPGGGPLSIQHVVHMACTLVGVGFDMIVGPGRTPYVVNARALAYYLVYRRGNGRGSVYSAPEVARAFGKANHSSVLTAVHRIQDQDIGQVEQIWERAMEIGEVTRADQAAARQLIWDLMGSQSSPGSTEGSPSSALASSC